MVKKLQLNNLASDIYEANKAKGFWDKERNVGELLMLITTELAEAMEAHRGRGNTLDRKTYDKYINNISKKSKEAFKFYFEENIKDTFEDEIADALIRILDLCGGLGIDIDFHVENKLKYNLMRERLHGKNY